MTTAKPIETIHCLRCGKPTGALPYDPWGVPPGCTVSAIAMCKVCRVEQTPAWLPMTPAPAGYTPSDLASRDPDESKISVVMVVRRRGSFTMVAWHDGHVVESSEGWPTRAAAFERGARTITEVGK